MANTQRLDVLRPRAIDFIPIVGFGTYVKRVYDLDIKEFRTGAWRNQEPAKEAFTRLAYNTAVISYQIPIMVGAVMGLEKLFH